MRIRRLSSFMLIKEARMVHRFPKRFPKVTRSMQEDEDDGLTRTEVITNPTSASW